MSGARLERTGAVASIVIDRPGAANAIDRATMHGLGAVVAELEADTSVAAVVVSAAGRGILSGGDIYDLAKIPTAADGEAMSLHMGGVLTRLGALPCPVIAALRSDTYGGGCEIALACDIRVIHHAGKMVFRQAAMGVTTGWGGGQRLAKLVGAGRAIMLLSTGASLNATEALMLGLVDGIGDGEDVLEDAQEMAETIAGFDVDAVRSMKRAIVEGQGRPMQEALANEAKIFGATWGGDAHGRAVTAFLRRR